MTIFEFFSLLGGVGLFLFGMTTMSSGLKNACGNNLQSILEKATKNKVTAVFVGLLMTMLIQSSSATDVMVIGFVNSGLMNLAQAIGVILGANIGTTITAQITAFNLSAYAPILLFAGAVMYLFMKKARVKHIGEIIMGFGMLFVGIAIMKEAIAPLSRSQGFIRMLSGLNNPVAAILFGIAFTALLQSSSSSTVIFQTFAIQGLLDYHTAVYLVIGAAIGSVTPNILASLTTDRNGKRTAVLNLLFNLFRAALLVLLIGLFPKILDLIQGLSPHDIGRQIANTHTIFAIFAVIVILPFTDKLIRLSCLILPVLPEENEELQDRSIQYMNQMTSVPASIAVMQAHREISRLSRIAAKNLHRSLECFFDYDEKKAAKVRAREESVNILSHSISDRMAELSTADLTIENMKRVSQMTLAITDCKRLSEHAENIIEYIEEMTLKRAEMSPAATEELRQMTMNTLDTVDLALDIFEFDDYTSLDELEAMEARVDRQENELVHSHIERLMHDECNPLAGVIFTDLVTALERCADHAVNLAFALKD